jgi:hypothetical protein
VIDDKIEATSFFLLSIYRSFNQVAQLKKFAEGSGLGISLEGTVDVENGQEVRPHHYIRSILPEGPVGQNGTLRSGDELLEVIEFPYLSATKPSL